MVIAIPLGCQRTTTKWLVMRQVMGFVGGLTQLMHVEQSFAVKPQHFRMPPRCPSQLLKLMHSIFVRVFGVDGFSILKVEGFASQLNELFFLADQVHLYPSQGRIVISAVRKTIQFES